jgi:hypothetical protein
MPVAEISAGLTSLRAALDITKAMIGLRDAEAFRAKSIELQGVVLEALEKAIEARESYAVQADRIRALEAELASLKEWDAEKHRYELKQISGGVTAYMLKPSERGGEPPHWLCPNCYGKRKKCFFQDTGADFQRRSIYMCAECQAKVGVSSGDPQWLD